MSFSSNAKEELIRIKIKGNHAKLAALCAINHAAGSLTIGASRSFEIKYTNELYSVTEYIMKLIMELYNVNVSISMMKTDRLNATNTIVSVLGYDSKRLLIDTGVLKEDDDGISFSNEIPENIIDDIESKRAFLRGAFIGAGSVNDPNSGYHLEIVCKNDEFAKSICEQMNELDLNAKITERKSNSVVYIKEGDKICDFLTFIGAMESILHFENVRVEKSIKNYINRTLNCDNANMDKTAKASAMQLEAIRIVIDNIGYDKLSEPLKQVVDARLDNPEASLKEISEIIGIGKSGVNHRFEKLLDLARGIKAGKDYL